MKRVEVIVLSLFILSCSTNIRKSSINPQYQVEIVQATGASAVVDGDINSARKAALSDALKSALQLVVGIYVSANSVVSKSVLIDDEITANTEGYIERYEVIKEYEEKGLYYVKIKAWVRKEELARKMRGVENEIERIGSPVVALRVEDKTDPSFKGAESALISEFKKDLFRMSFSTSDVDVIVEGGVSTSFNTSEGLGGFISYRCYIEGKIYTSYGEPVGGFAHSSAGVGLNDTDARNNASVACARMVYPSIKDAIISFYLTKRTLRVEIEDVNSLNDVAEIIKFFKNIPLVRNLSVKSYENSKCIIDLILHKAKTDEIYLAMNRSSLFKIKKISQFLIVAEKR